ncbi:MAG: HAD family hydrolase [Comamonas sp.]
MSRRFDLIAFDWDGTLFDSAAAIALSIQDAVRDLGGTVPTLEQAKYVIGMSLNRALAHAAPDVPAERHAELGNRYRYHYLRRQEEVTLFDGVLPLLEELAGRGHLLAVATGKSRRGLDEVLASTLLKGRFHASRTADETAGKPSPLMLQELMAELDVAPGRLLMVGDTTHDLEMAVNAGCASVGVSYGAHDPAGFEAFRPLYVAQTVAQLQRWMADNA